MAWDRADLSATYMHRNMSLNICMFVVRCTLRTGYTSVRYRFFKPVSPLYYYCRFKLYKETKLQNHERKPGLSCLQSSPRGYSIVIQCLSLSVGLSPSSGPAGRQSVWTPRRYLTSGWPCQHVADIRPPDGPLLNMFIRIGFNEKQRLRPGY